MIHRPLIGLLLLMLATGCRPPAEPMVPANLGDIDVGVREVIEKAIARVRKHPHESRAWMHLGSAYLAHELNREAAHAFAESDRLSPSAESLTLRAIALDRAGNFQDRRIAIDAAIAVDGDASIPLWRGAIWALEQGELPRAATLAAQATRHPDAGPADTLVLASVRLAQGRPTEAVSLIEPILNQRPESPRAQWLMGRGLLALGQHERAARHLTLAGNTPPALYDPWLQRAETARADLNARIGRVAAMSKSGDIESASAAIRSLSAMYGDLREIQLAEATLAFKRGERLASDRMLVELAEAWPGWSPPLLQLASQRFAGTEFGRGSPGQARDAVDRAMENSPGNADGWMLRGRIARQQRDLAAATESFERVNRLAPARPRPYLSLAEMYIATGQPRDAVEVLNAHESLFGSRPTAALIRMQALLAMGRPREAASLFEETRTRFPRHQAVGRMKVLLEREGSP